MSNQAICSFLIFDLNLTSPGNVILVRLCFWLTEGRIAEKWELVKQNSLLSPLFYLNEVGQGAQSHFKSYKILKKPCLVGAARGIAGTRATINLYRFSNERSRVCVRCASQLGLSCRLKNKSVFSASLKGRECMLGTIFKKPHHGLIIGTDYFV